MAHNVGVEYRGFRIDVSKRTGETRGKKNVFGKVYKGTKKTETTVYRILDADDYRLTVNASTGEKSSEIVKVQAWTYKGNLKDAKRAIDALIDRNS